MADPLVISAVIASGVAIAQPWLIALWKNHIRQGRIQSYVSGFLEIGFGQYGPTLAIDGTLRGINRDIFVKSSRVILTSTEDNSQHEFEWAAFRPHRIPITPSTNTERFIETASGFMITPDTPKRICIFFSDSQTREKVYSKLNSAYNTFRELRFNEKYSVLNQTWLDQTEMNKLRMELAEEYRNHVDHINAYTEIDRTFYWKSGKYIIELQIKSARPDKTFCQKWEIEITEDQSKQLRLNTVIMIDALLWTDANLNAPAPYSEYVPYKEM
jgi:hypothetical protein